jgi:Flp pilus assembly protein TadD
MPLKKRKCIWWLNASWLILLSCIISNTSMAADSQQWVAKAVSVQGVVQVQRAGDASWKDIGLGDQLYGGDIVRVLEKSRAALVLQNESVVRLDEKTTITIRSEEEAKSLLLRIINGAVHFFSRVRHSLRVATPFVNGAVEGTEFFVKVDLKETYFSVFEGRVRIFNDAGELLLADNSAAITTKSQAPVFKTEVHPREAVNWALYYPRIVPTVDSVGDLRHLSVGDLLEVGRVDAARSLLEQIIAMEPRNSEALALMAIIELVQNKKEKARELAEKAVASNSKSSAAKMALAYVRQAFFEVEEARDILKAAVVDDPHNALLWARLSELWLATGYQKQALSAAKKASMISPEVSRNQTVLGFAYISQIKITDAKAAFQKAIELDQADPLPRLGLGLAMIREGDLKSGREQIEIAAALDPGNALVRSYLGKAFYEEKNTLQAERQYEVAKALDPNDPTPYF